ncbi:MAG: 4-hydroxy-tetrahydrodipicolinate synthase [Deltaproteobacteria bacterium]|nr:4-hydroxy-tetrahydrodipicolinate synthase [Deltaproteobacteria bacterium]
MDNSGITGLGTALVTPFKANGDVDMAAFERFIQFQIEGGVNFLVPLGTTGETPTLEDREQDEIVKLSLRMAKGKVPVVVGCTSNNTREAIERGKRFKALGVQHILSACPYYNKPTQEGIYQHYKAIRKETGLEIVLYNVPGRTASNALPDTIARLAEEKVVFAVKEASGSILQMQQLCQKVNGALTVLSGDDAMTLPLMAVGGQGVISVASNLVPRPMRQWVDTMTERNYIKAREQLKPLLPLFDACFVESNPIPVKGGAKILGLMEMNYRLPMVPPSEQTLNTMRTVLRPFMA